MRARTLQNAESLISEKSTSQIAQGLDQIKQVFNTLTAKNVEDIRSIYTDKVVFIDPFVEIHGVDALVQHMARQYANLNSCEFEYREQFIESNRASLRWFMSIRHRSLSRNKTITVDGMTLFEFDESNISFQRDYYDAGAMLYENVPLLGSVIRKIRKRLV